MAAAPSAARLPRQPEPPAASRTQTLENCPTKAVLSGDETPSRPPEECAIVARLPKQSRSWDQVRPLLLADEISGNLQKIKYNYIFYTLGTTCEELTLENTRSVGV